MMEKSAQAGVGGGCTRPPPFTISTVTYKVVVYAPAESADTLPLFLLYPYTYSVVGKLNCSMYCGGVTENEITWRISEH